MEHMLLLSSRAMNYLYTTLLSKIQRYSKCDCVVVFDNLYLYGNSNYI